MTAIGDELICARVLPGELQLDVGESGIVTPTPGNITDTLGGAADLDPVKFGELGAAVDDNSGLRVTM